MKRRRCRRDISLCGMVAIAFAIGLLLALFGSLRVIVFFAAILLITLVVITR